MAPHHMVISLITAFWIALATPQQATTGAYRILIDGKPAGAERFEKVFSPGGFTVKSSGEATTFAGTQKITTTTQVQDDKPVRYFVAINSGAGAQAYDIEFGPERARVMIEIGGKRSERSVSVSKDAVLLDNDVWHHYGFLLSKYDLPRRGKQRFQVFIPRAGLREFSAEVEFKGTTSFGSGVAKMKANKFAITLAEGFEVSAIADQQGVPLSIEIRSRDTKAVLE